MSAITFPISPSPIRESISSPPLIQTLSSPSKWTYLIPTISVIALGCFFIPHFSLGLGAGVVMLAGSAVLAFALYALGISKKTDNNSEYDQQIRDNPILASIIGPVLEEVAFRGLLLPTIARIALRILPFAAAPFLGTGMLVATAIGIGCSAVAFGAIHLFNSHENAKSQALVCAVAGIAHGVLYATFGLGASIAAHIMNNTIVVILSKIGE